MRKRKPDGNIQVSIIRSTSQLSDIKTSATKEKKAHHFCRFILYYRR